MSNRQARRDQQRQVRQQARQETRPPRVRPAAATAKRSGAPPPGRSLPWGWIAAGVIAAILVAGGLVYVIRESNVPLPGKTYPSLGNGHIDPGQGHPPYNSNPPTSGWHYPTVPKRGIYTEALPEESVLHFQEHAGVVVHYNPDKLPTDQVTQLRGIVNRELNTGQGHVLLSPDPTIPQPVAVTSWQHLVELDGVTGNVSKIEEAIERLQCNYDPEGVCGPPHGNSFQPTPAPAGQATVIGQTVPSSVATATAVPGQRPETQTPVPGTPTP
jgi:hypothetical protein